MLRAIPPLNALRATYWLRLSQELVRVGDGCASFNQGENNDKGIRGCTSMINSGGHKGRAIAYHDRGGPYQTKGDYARAIANYDQALRQNPKSASAYNNRVDVPLSVAGPASMPTCGLYIRIGAYVWPFCPLSRDHTLRSTIFLFNSAICLPGLRPLGQTCAQFKMVWQR
jgi:tetratricopeptide (TPR) repeat protein